MEPLGVLVGTIGAYLTWCGLHSVKALPALEAIAANPGNAAAILKQAAADAAAEKPPLTNTQAQTLAATGDPAAVIPNLIAGVSPFAQFGVGEGYGQTGGGTYGGLHTHQGIDYEAPDNTPLPSWIDGTVTIDPSYLGGYGITVHGTGTFAGWSVNFEHVKSYDAKAGQSVKAGDIIAHSGGAAGDPGKGDATGPHVFVMTTHNGAICNPSIFLAWCKANATLITSTMNPFLAGGVSG